MDTLFNKIAKLTKKYHQTNIISEKKSIGNEYSKLVREYQNRNESKRKEINVKTLASYTEAMRIINAANKR